MHTNTTARRTLLCATLATAFASLAQAQSVFTTNNAATSWGTAGNWTPSGVPSGVDVAVEFNTPVGGNQTISSYGAGRIIGSFTINNASDFEQSFTSISSLTFDVTAGNATLQRTDTTGTLTSRITSPVVLNDPLNLNIANTVVTDVRGALSLSGVVSGSSRITKTGAGTASVGGSTNTFTGGVQINQGTYRITGLTGVGAAPGSFVANQVGINGGRLQYDGSGNTLSSNVGFTIGASGGEIAVTGSGSYTIAGVMTGGTLTKTGASTLVLTGANTFTGGIVINAGTVSIGTMSALGSTAASNTNAVIINGGTLKFTAATVRAGANRGYRVGSSTGTIDVDASVEARLQGGLRDVTSQVGVLRKIGTGSLSMEGVTNSFTGGTLLEEGTLRLNGNIFGGAAGAGLTVSTGATLEGFGTVNGASTFADGSTIRLATYDTTSTAVPNPITSSIGTFTFNNNLTLGDVNLFFDLDSTGASDRITVASGGTLNLGAGVFDLSNFTFNTLGGYGIGTYTLLSSSSSIAGSLGSTLTGTLGGFDIALGFGNSGQSIDLIVTAIPEPSAYAALAGLGILGFAATRRRRA